MRQGLLTRAVNRLTAILDENQELTTMSLTPPLEADKRRVYTRTQRLRIRTTKATLESEVLNVDRALEQYNYAADNLDPDTPSIVDILQKVSSNVDTTARLLDRAHTTLTTMARLQEEINDMEHYRYATNFATSSEVPQMTLAPIPIPKFSGRIWEWDTFWGAFEHSSHSRPIDNLYKMNYLLDAP
ncbi:hypothetical protein ANCCAN_08550 [Ancylostoma caninum]|uniref:Uncharacterized protein n=1 Tax=Ancylostoma caninum TaxID=29170 RepID=A0A368GM61_ANCCA|nr:hypothetical protein ANCCAN_08550 [Ancylostoma caninum]